MLYIEMKENSFKQAIQTKFIIPKHLYLFFFMFMFFSVFQDNLDTLRFDNSLHCYQGLVLWSSN